MEVATGLLALLDYWMFLYWLAGAPVAMWMYDATMALEKLVGMR